MTAYYHYYVDDQLHPESGAHEVHKEDCSSLALAKRKTYLGYYDDCNDAILKAKTIYSHTKNCEYCCAEWHEPAKIIDKARYTANG